TREKAAATKNKARSATADVVESASNKKKGSEAAKNKKTNHDACKHNKEDDALSGQQDGSGGLNQSSPFNVEYSKLSHATCRTCDQVISKGDIRVGHTPLFRGKPGYMVFWHLHCAVFSEDVTCAEDVINYDTLDDANYQRLADQVEASKSKIKEEMEELEPDELVQKSFEGEI
ncbi:hypothetical protein ACHAWX_003640, partial [Stephanocyclus meneghinianus]